MEATIKSFLAPGRAIATGEKGQEFRVTIPVNRTDIVAGSKVKVSEPKDAKKTIGTPEGIKEIGFKEAALVLS